MAHPLPPFQWPKTAESIAAKADEIVAQTKANLDRVAGLRDEELTYDNVVGALCRPPNYKTNPELVATKFLQHISTDKSLRDAASEAGTKFAQARVEGRMRRDVFEVVSRYAKTPAAESLSPYEKHFLQSILDDFQRSGLALDDAQSKRLKELLAEDSSLCAAYSKNVGEDDTTLFLTPEELQGLPAAFISERTGADGKVKLTLKYPDVIPVMSNAEIGATRRKVAMARETAYKDNLDIMARSLSVRLEAARLLGADSWARFVTAKRMTKTPEKVTSFLEDLRKQLVEPAQVEMKRLLALKEEFEKGRGEAVEGTLHAYDLSFFHNLLLKREYGVDDERIKEFFPVDAVVEGAMEIYQRLLGLTFQRLHDFDSWHESLQLYIVHDVATKELIGHFYLDLHPRDGKYNHAAIFHLLKRSGDQAPVDCMVANLPAPSADGTPALLRHSDVVTFFHEFGHIMHGLCAVGDANSTRHAKCPRDFVEAPSQMLENWCWQPSVLAKMSRHYKTGEPLPPALVADMVKAKHVNVALFTLRQIYLSTLDMRLHSATPPTTVEEIQQLVDTLRPEVSLFPNPPGCNMLRSFGHLMNQYSASYYGYLWAEVLSADMFHTRFDAEGVENPDTGRSYRDLILAPGGVGDIADHVANFLGRPPENTHFLRSRGLIQ